MEQTNSESKRDRFKRIATLRTNQVINKLRILGNCSSRNNYTYTDEEVEKIFNRIEEELAIIKHQFKRPGSTRFEL